MRPRVFPAEDLRGPDEHAERRAASMRPRVFPAEDYRCRHRTASGSIASMRPRVFPAEDSPPLWPIEQAIADASMRPRVFPAEDDDRTGATSSYVCRFNEAAGIPRGRPVGVLDDGAVFDHASMRPRVFPAEDARLGAVGWLFRRLQ